MAHAWIYTNVSDATRAEYLTVREIDTWNDPDIAHAARGTEIAANTLMYVLHPDEPTDPGHSCGYELITNHHAPDNRADPCAMR